MFLFLRKRKILGLDITEERIRYVLVEKSRETTKLILCAEEKVPRVEPKNALLYGLRSIVQKSGCTKAHVSFPADFVRPETVSVSSKTRQEDIVSELGLRLTERKALTHGESIFYYEKIESINNKDFYTVFVSSNETISFLKSVFVHAGLDIQKVVSRKDALLASCVKEGEIINTMVINADAERVDLAIFSPFNRFKGVSVVTGKENIPRLIAETHQDFYGLAGDRIGYFMCAGSSTSDISFINYLSRETRLPVSQTDIFANVSLGRGELPLVTKNESFNYAIALGAAMR